ncbi:MAG: glycine cleavage system protein GcvH [Flectobacillus sp.]|uniref:glycine cleavage system protein GcvH n=1 Tax=Flectobacillus sp. TaxID=50419 RepID=UPI003B9B91BB
MNFPEELRYTREHEWIKVDGDVAIVGITDFAQSELGDIVYVEIETLGQTLAEGDIFGTVEAVKTVSDLFLPIAGEIVEVNETVTDSPEIINSDAYGEGWLVKIKPSNIAEVEGLMDFDTYKRFCGL